MNRIDRTQLIWATTEGPEAPRRVAPVSKTTAAIMRARDKFRSSYPNPNPTTTGRLRQSAPPRLDILA